MKINLLETSHLDWQNYGPDTRFSYPIGYSGALLSYDGKDHIDLLYRWEPGKYCHFHRHLCEVRSTVLAGSLEVVTFEDGKEVSSIVREVGSYSHMPQGDVHMERGGPEGAVVDLKNAHHRISAQTICALKSRGLDHDGFALRGRIKSTVEAYL